MKYLICYDVADDQRRTRLSKLLLDFGRRIQESVFWVDLDEKLYEEMKRRIGECVDLEEDSIFVSSVCASCLGRMQVVGRTELPEEQDYYIV